MKYEMMLRILFYLLARGKTSASKLASRFDISTRSVIRYVNEISLAGIPIIADNGRNGGYYIADSYRSHTTPTSDGGLILTPSGV